MDYSPCQAETSLISNQKAAINSRKKVGHRRT